LEGKRKRERPCKRWGDAGEEDLNVMEILKQAGSEWPEAVAGGGR
jgi:hypothetical protein